jgi:hypothetical protein
LPKHSEAYCLGITTKTTREEKRERKKMLISEYLLIRNQDNINKYSISSIESKILGIEFSAGWYKKYALKKISHLELAELRKIHWKLDNPHISKALGNVNRFGLVYQPNQSKELEKIADRLLAKCVY